MARVTSLAAFFSPPELEDPPELLEELSLPPQAATPNATVTTIATATATDRGERLMRDDISTLRET